MAATEAQILDRLRTIEDPDLRRDIVSLGFVKNVKIEGGKVSFDIDLTTPACPVRDQMEAAARAAVGAIPGVQSVNIRLTSTARGYGLANLSENLKGVRNIIAIASGKGGVGKSTATVNLALALQDAGARVGVLDADVYGPSIPGMLGVPTDESRPMVPDAAHLKPVERHGVKAMSMALLTTKDTPVVWRGPMATKLLQQFLGSVEWGDLDYLLVDLPPGTGDISLSLAQFLPGMAMVVVTTPQPVAQKVAERAANMAGRVNLRVLGVVENMSGVVCEHCGETTAIFGEGGGRELAGDLGVPLLAEIPLVPALRSDSDEGTPFVWVRPDHPVTQKFLELARQVASYRPKRRLPVTQTKRP